MRRLGRSDSIRKAINTSLSYSCFRLGSSRILLIYRIMPGHAISIASSTNFGSFLSVEARYWKKSEKPVPLAHILLPFRTSMPTSRSFRTSSGKYCIISERLISTFFAISTFEMHRANSGFRTIASTIFNSSSSSKVGSFESLKTLRASETSSVFTPCFRISLRACLESFTVSSLTSQ